MANRIVLNETSYHGAGAIAEIANEAKTRAFKKAFVCSDPDLIKFGVTKKVTDVLDNAGLAYEIYSNIKPNPTIENVQTGVAAFKKSGADYLIAIGGGSPIDAAKAMWIFYEHPDFTFEEAAKPFNLPEMRNKAHFIAISTTSGTATEVTSFSVITDNETGIKYPIADYNITPDVAILDTTLVEKMPQKLVANTGMDALTHALEAYVSTVANPFTDALAMRSIEMIVKNLVKSYNGDMEARKQMHLAQNLAGMSFSNAILGIAHSMAHKSGAILDVPHGLANAIYLPNTVLFNSKNAVAGSRYTEIAQRIGLNGNNEQELVTALVDQIKKMRSELGMAGSLKEFGIDEEVFMSKVDNMAVTAVADPCTSTNPREITSEEMKALYIAAYNGEDIAF